jgi:hypothetical protein
LDRPRKSFPFYRLLFSVICICSATQFQPPIDPYQGWTSRAMHLYHHHMIVFFFLPRRILWNIHRPTGPGFFLSPFSVLFYIGRRHSSCFPGESAFPFYLKDKDTLGRPVPPARQTRKGHRHGVFSYPEIPNVSIFHAAARDGTWRRKVDGPAGRRGREDTT